MRSTSQETIAFIRTTDCRIIAEVGILNGDTSEKIASHLNEQGALHLFDYEERVNAVKARLHACGYDNIVGHANSHKTFDSYNWNLMRMLKQHPQPVFDYVYLDGAHTWHHDALAFLLFDRMLNVGGYIDFDDYQWSFERSPSLNPRIAPHVSALYTDTQIKECQVGLVVDLLVKPDRRYTSVVENKIYRKIAP